MEYRDNIYIFEHSTYKCDADKWKRSEFKGEGG
jgi:hypothetical protein